jgi:hypothetical protein
MKYLRAWENAMEASESELKRVVYTTIAVLCILFGGLVFFIV